MLVDYALGVLLTAVDASPIVFVRVMQSYSTILLIFQVILLLVGFVPESPISLMKKNKLEEAKEVIGFFASEVNFNIEFKNKQTQF